VQEGCDLFCTFCIVPMARGRSRSVEPRRVLAELERLAALGYQEAVLTGIHLGGYGKDLTPSLAFADLVEMIAEAAPLPRIRLSSIDPPEVTPRLLDMLATSPVLCEHLHMPVQAGADGVLRRMRRLYDARLVRDVAAEIHRRLPGAGLGTDVIAGIPRRERCGIRRHRGAAARGRIHVSACVSLLARTGTTAAKASDHLPAPVIRARARALRRLGAQQREAFAEDCIGRELDVLIETTRDRATGQLIGYSRNYARVLVTVRMRSRTAKCGYGRWREKAIGCAANESETPMRQPLGDEFRPSRRASATASSTAASSKRR
jgi:threonylcarbamoyladenosine tRNA methylthiotransferase MtaB